ncbi:hypothetical protein AAG570_001792 [Ranatra chinensis]|uniref:T-box domain-containing protein n=1 Tax=Ranatra chinensis TaxID=642074 RepID=A0ABD0Y9U0_9HEMI
MLVGTLQEELPPPAKSRATDFSIAAIMARADHGPRTATVSSHLQEEGDPGDSGSEEEDVEVDVEECSESEESERKDLGGGRGGGGGGSPPHHRPRLKCNCPELLAAQCHLETKELWDKFHDLGTEMIITKTGR